MEFDSPGNNEFNGAVEFTKAVHKKRSLSRLIAQFNRFRGYFGLLAMVGKTD